MLQFQEEKPLLCPLVCGVTEWGLTSGNVLSGFLLSAYKTPADGTVAVVAANPNNSDASLSVFVDGAAPCSMTPWVTSNSDSLASGSAVSVAASQFGFSLAAKSVTTFVGMPETS